VSYVKKFLTFFNEEKAQNFLIFSEKISEKDLKIKKDFLNSLMYNNIIILQNITPVKPIEM